VTRAFSTTIHAGRSTDESSRRIALDSARSFIVQAPAGSGKTGLLVQRYLRLLAEATRPESVVALTFTRKAAREMQQRVVAALEAASDTPPESLHGRVTWELARKVRAQDQAHGWRLVEHPSRLRIQTIDALCRSIVTQMPWVSGLGVPSETDENVGHLYRRASRRTLESLGRSEPGAGALATLLGHLDNDMALAEARLGEMLPRRDQWLRHVVGVPDPQVLRRRFDTVLGAIIADELGGIVDRFREEELRVLVEAGRFAGRILLEGRNLPAGPNLPDDGPQSPVQACAGLREPPGPDVGGLPAWRGLAEMLVTRDGRRRRRLTVAQGFPPTEEGRTWKAAVLGIRLDADVISRLSAVRFLPPPEYTDRQWKILGALLELLPRAVAHLRLIFQEEGRVDFTELAQAARTALATPDGPTALAFALDCRIQHVLVDEFQDTSQSQFDLIEVLISDWESGDGRTLFLVGDPMQSIYRFRDADVALFMDSRRRGIGRITPSSLTLSSNFRSRPEIVDWVNRSLGPAFGSKEDMLRGAVAYEPSVSCAPSKDAYAGTSAVCVYPFLGKRPEAEADEVLRIVHEARRRDPGGTIAVLVRARPHLAHIILALRRAGLPFQAVEIDRLASRPAVRDVLALMRALSDPADRISWLSVLRAPWCGLSLSDLDALVDGNAASAVWDLIQARLSQTAAESGARLSDEGYRRLERVRGILADAIAVRGTMALRRWVEETWLALGGPATVETLADLEDVRACLDLVGQMAPAASIPDEDRFLEGVDKLFARSGAEMPGEAGNLQLLTIHKAKGLEFDTVILPGLGRAPRADTSSLLNWLEYVDHHGESQLLLAPVPEAGGGADPLSTYLSRVDGSRREQETTRLLYVAATRTRHQLHILGHAFPLPEGSGFRPPDSRSLLARIWHQVEGDFLRELAGQKLPEVVRPQELDRPRSIRRLASSWKLPDIPAPMEIPGDFVPGAGTGFEPIVRQPSFDWASDLQRRVGIVVHSALQRISLPQLSGGPLRDDRIRAALSSEGVGRDRLDEAAARVRESIDTALRDPRGRWILDVHDEDRREYPIACLGDGRIRHYVLDRTFVERGVRWIIDYKTSLHEGGGLEAFMDNERERYRSQLEGYAYAMAAIESRPIRLGLYFPALAGWREWDFDPSRVRHRAPEGTGEVRSL